MRLQWQVESAKCRIHPLIGDVEPKGERVLQLCETTVFRLDCEAADDRTLQQEQVVTVLFTLEHFIVNHKFFVFNPSPVMSDQTCIEVLWFHSDGSASYVSDECAPGDEQYYLDGDLRRLNGTWAIQDQTVTFTALTELGETYILTLKYDPSKNALLIKHDDNYFNGITVMYFRRDHTIMQRV